MKPVDFLFSPGILKVPKVPVSYIQHVDTGTFIYIYLSYTTYSLARLFTKSY